MSYRGTLLASAGLCHLEPPVYHFREVGGVRTLSSVAIYRRYLSMCSSRVLGVGYIRRLD